MPPSDQPPPLPKAPHRGRLLKICIAILALPIVFALILFRIYGTDATMLVEVASGGRRGAGI